jgi:hypothetical protein
VIAAAALDHVLALVGRLVAAVDPVIEERRGRKRLRHFQVRVLEAALEQADHVHRAEVRLVVHEEVGADRGGIAFGAAGLVTKLSKICVMSILRTGLMPMAGLKTESASRIGFMRPL